MVRRNCFGALLFLAAATGAAPARAAAPELEQEAAHRFPQPVLVGALLGRDVLGPTEAQPILGHVAGVVRRADGQIDMIVRYGGLLGIGERAVAVPIEAMALLGEYVALVGVQPTELQALPTAGIAAGTALPPGETIRVGLVGPFH